MIIVVGVDDSPISKVVLGRAIEEAHLRNAELHVVHVLYLPAVYGEIPIDMSEVAEAQRRAVWEMLQPILDEADIPAHRVDLDGYPPDALVRYASANDAAMLVVGTRGRGELASLILGSTSHRAIHLAECDVLVVKSTEIEIR